MTHQVTLAILMAAILGASPAPADKPKSPNAPECRTTYDCCLKKHPQDAEVCGAEPGGQPKAKKKFKLKSEKASEEAL
jgi:hypothetical protein